MLVKSNLPLTDDNRCEFLASPNGILGQSYNAIKQVLMEGRENQLHFVEYDELTTNPKETMKKIYEFLEEPYFEHDFSNLVNQHQENDAQVYGLADMHVVRNELKKTSLNPEEVLSQKILQQCEGAEFWRDLAEVKFDNDATLDNDTTLDNEVKFDSDATFIG